MSSRLCIALAIVVLIGCDAGGATQISNSPASLEIVVPDTVGFQQTFTATAVALDQDGRVVPAADIEWRADERILGVTSDGSVTALRPGVGRLIARVGALADSVPISVVTSSCPPPYIQIIDVSGNGFHGSAVNGGWLDLDRSTSGHTEYNGVPFFWGAGVLLGTHPDSVLIGYNYHGYNISDFSSSTSRVCRTGSGFMHTLARLEVNTAISPGPPVIPGLVVVQEQFAYGNDEDHGYVLFRYEVTNTRPTPISDLHVGFISDFDVYNHLNIGGYDPVAQTAYVMSPDSLGEGVVAGTIVIGSDVTTYATTPVDGGIPDRADYFALLTRGTVMPERTAVQDVKQVVVPPSMTLAAGETRDVWFALVVGADSTRFMQNVDAARRQVELIQ